jgi:Tol biopolymer transport system component
VFVPLTAGLNTDKVERSPSISSDANVIVFQSDRTGGQGQMDVWVHTRSSGTTNQGFGLSSTVDDVQPYLLWR